MLKVPVFEINLFFFFCILLHAIKDVQHQVEENALKWISVRKTHHWQEMRGKRSEPSEPFFSRLASKLEWIFLKDKGIKMAEGLTLFYEAKYAWNGADLRFRNFMRSLLETRCSDNCIYFCQFWNWEMFMQRAKSFQWKLTGI